MTKSRSDDGARLVDTLVRHDQRDFQHCDIRDLNMHGVFVLGRDGSLTRLPKDAPKETVEVAVDALPAWLNSKVKHPS